MAALGRSRERVVVMSESDFMVMWQLYKDIKKRTKQRNTLLLVDMMTADAGLYMTKEIFRDYSKFQ